MAEDRMDVRNGNDFLKKSSVGNFYHTSKKMKEVGSIGIDGGRKVR